MENETIIWYSLPIVMPYLAEQLLVVTEYKGQRFVCPAWYDGDGKFQDLSGRVIKVFWWAYLPKGPKT